MNSAEKPVNGRNRHPEQGTERKPYRGPELTEYGKLSDLTQGSVGAALDFGGTTPTKAN